MSNLNATLSRILATNAVEEARKHFPAFRVNKHVGVLHSYSDLYMVEVTFADEKRWETYVPATGKLEAKAYGIAAWLRFKGIPDDRGGV